MRRVIVLCIFVMTMLLVGCGTSNVNDNEINKIVGGKANRSDDYKIVEKEYIAYDKDNTPFKVKYAQVSGLGNESLESQINQILKSSTTEWINKDCEWAERFQVDVKYKTSSYLFLYYWIEWKDPRGEDYMSTFTRFGVTINMQTGERVYLDDFIKDIDSLKQKLLNYNYGDDFSPTIDSEEEDKIIHKASISEKNNYEEIHKTDPLVYDFMLSYLSKKPTFYVTDHKIVITKDEYEMNDVYIDYQQ